MNFLEGENRPKVIKRLAIIAVGVSTAFVFSGAVKSEKSYSAPITPIHEDEQRVIPVPCDDIILPWNPSNMDNGQSASLKKPEPEPTIGPECFRAYHKQNNTIYIDF